MYESSAPAPTGDLATMSATGMPPTRGPGGLPGLGMAGMVQGGMDRAGMDPARLGQAGWGMAGLGIGDPGRQLPPLGDYFASIWSGPTPGPAFAGLSPGLPSLSPRPPAPPLPTPAWGQPSTPTTPTTPLTPTTPTADPADQGWTGFWPPQWGAPPGPGVEVRIVNGRPVFSTASATTSTSGAPTTPTTSTLPGAGQSLADLRAQWRGAGWPSLSQISDQLSQHPRLAPLSALTGWISDVGEWVQGGGEGPFPQPAAPTRPGAAPTGSTALANLPRLIPLRQS